MWVTMKSNEHDGKIANTWHILHVSERPSHFTYYLLLTVCAWLKHVVLGNVCTIQFIRWCVDKYADWMESNWCDPKWKGVCNKNEWWFKVDTFHRLDCYCRFIFSSSLFISLLFGVLLSLFWFIPSQCEIWNMKKNHIQFSKMFNFIIRF